MKISIFYLSNIARKLKKNIFTVLCAYKLRLQLILKTLMPFIHFHMYEYMA